MPDYEVKIGISVDTPELDDAEKRINDLVNKKQTINIDTSGSVKNIDGITDSVKNAQKSTLSFGDIFKRALGIGTTATLAVKSIRLIGKAAKEAFENVKVLDKSMTELRKVTDETPQTYKKILSDASTTAKEIGTSINGLIDSTADFARLGYSIGDSQQLAKTANIYAQIGDGVGSVDAATKSIISTMAAFNISANDSIKIVDKFNEVGNNYAISSGGIGAALERSASSMAAAGNSLDQSIALITAANTVVQNPESIGTAFKTITMRIRGAKTELEDAGLSTEGMATSVSKLRDEIRALSGVDIMQNDSTFKSTYQIMDELSQKWKELSDIQKASITELIAGKRQGNIVSSLMDNFNIARNALNSSLNSDGSAMAEHAKWLDSIEAKTNQLKAAFESLSVNTISSDIVGGIVQATTELVAFLDKSNLVKTSLAGLVAYGGIKGFTAIASGIVSAATAMDKFNTALSIAKSSNIGKSQFDQLVQITTTLSASQANAIITAKALSTEQRIAILTARGMSQAEAEAALASMGLASAEGAVTASTLSLKGAFQGLMATLKPFAPLLIGAAAAFATFKTMQYYSFDGFYKRATKDQEALEATKNTLAETASAIENNKAKIEELRSQRSSGTGGSVSDINSEIRRLEQENAILEQKKKIYEENQKIEQQKAAESARKALTQTDLYDTQVFNEETGVYENKREKRTILENIRAEIKEAERLQGALDDNAESIANLDTSTKEGQDQFKKLSDQRRTLQSALINTQTSINGQKEQILNLYNSLFDNDGNILAGYEDVAKKVESIFPEFNPSKYVKSQFSNRRDGGNDLIKWYSELSSDQQKIVFDLVLNSDTATWNLEKFKSELETTEKVAGLLQDANPLEDFKSSIAKAIETQNNLTAAIAAGNSATGMTFEQMQNVISAFEDIKDFDMATLFENTATGIQMNTEAFDKYNKKVQEIETAQMLDAIIAKTEEYNNALNSADKEKAFKELIQLQAMLDEYYASISKYNAYVTATSSANARDSYGNVVTGYKSIGELIKQGWTTDDSVISYMELVGGYSWNGEGLVKTMGDGEEVVLSTAEAYKKLSENIDGTTHSLKDYLTTDSSGNLTSQGVWRFAEDAVKLGFGTKGENGLLELNLTGDNLTAIAEKLGTTTDMVELFGKALSEAGMNVHFEPIANQIKNLEKQAKDLKDQIANSTDDEETTKLMSELNEVNNKTIKKKIIAQVEGGQSVSDLLAMDDATLSATLDIDVGDAEKAREIIEEIGKASGEVPINVKIDEGQLQAILGSLTGTVEVTPEVSEQPEFKDTSVDVTPNVTEQPKFSPQTVNVSGGGTGGGIVSSIKNLVASGKANFKLGSYPKTVPSISGTVNYKGNFPTSAPTIYGKAIYTATVQNPPSGGAITVSTGTMTSVAHADGTAYNVLNYQRLSPSHAGGRVSLPADEYALTNEIGRESIVRDGIWYMLPPGPHMEHLRKGDIVFSAKQTEDLLKAGRTSTYAKALSAGTINALANGSIHAYSGYTGSGYNPWASAGGGYKGGSASTIGSGASSSGGGGSNTSSKDDEHKIDWIEVAIKRFEALLKKLASIAENTFNNLTTRLEATTENLVSTSKDIDLQGKAYDRYIKEANSVGLDAGIAEKVRNGEIDINSYNEDTRKKIEEYKKWYEKADDCATAIEELKTQLGELYKNKFDYIQKDYEDRLDLMQEQAIKFDKELQRLEAQGYKADAAIYESQVNDRTQRINVMKSQLTDMQKAFDDLNASGFLQEGSEAWYEMMLEIQKVKNEIDDTDIEIIQLNNTIRQLKWDSFDSALSLISDLNDEADFLIDLLEDGKMTDDAGNLTEDAMAVLGMHAQKMDTFIGKSQRYAEEIARLDKEISKDPMNNTLIERRKELLKLQRESILAANDEKAAMKDLVSEGIDGMLFLLVRTRLPIRFRLCLRLQERSIRTLA